MNRSFLIAAAISAFSLGAAGAAWPASMHMRDLGDAIAVGIDISDLDPSRPQDAMILIDRVRAASRMACRAAVQSTPVDYGEIESLDDCTRTAADRAIATLNAPEVTALYQAGALAQAGAGR
jgi:UrcA family protein